jgi:threonine dehydratase
MPCKENPMTSLFDEIAEADIGIRPQVPISRLERSSALSEALGCEVMLKTDHLMPTGSFKVRGSANKIRTLGEAARDGVITASTGNHGQGVARAGKLAGIPVTVYVPSSAPPAKMRAIEALGATLVVFDGPSLDAEIAARHQSEVEGKPYVAPYNDYHTIAGQGTLGVELYKQAPDLDAVFICVGGGGLISGVGTALKQLSPQTTIVGVWPEASRCMLDSLLAGHIVETPEYDTLSDGSTGAVEPGSVTFPICQAVIDQTLTVSEIEIARGMRRIAEAERWMIEGSAGVAVAGLVQTAGEWRGRKVAVVLCGRNISVETFMGAMELGRET